MLASLMRCARMTRSPWPTGPQRSAGHKPSAGASLARSSPRNGFSLEASSKDQERLTSMNTTYM